MMSCVAIAQACVNGEMKGNETQKERRGEGQKGLSLPSLHYYLNTLVLVPTLACALCVFTLYLLSKILFITGIFLHSHFL